MFSAVRQSGHGEPPGLRCPRDAEHPQRTGKVACDDFPNGKEDGWKDCEPFNQSLDRRYPAKSPARHVVVSKVFDTEPDHEDALEIVPRGTHSLKSFRERFPP